ncbi:MAG: glycerophosphodiester phosphodiesterase [Bacillota bacterium]|nr:glycerophosphodiester phosphodiesterase [Bacillota bacterium]
MKRKSIVCIIFVMILSIVLIENNEYIKGLQYDITKNIPTRFEEKNGHINNIIEDKNIKVIAHRGRCSGEPENSLSAINSSINTKVDYAEIDVQETRDGVVVLMHDKNLKRLTGVNKNVDQLNFSQIEKLNIASSAHGNDIEKIPTLDEVIKQCKGKLNLIIEIKLYSNTADLTNKVVKIIENNNFVSQCKIHSYSYRVLLNVKQLNSNIQTGYIIYRPISNLSSLNVDFYSVQENMITKEMVSDIHNGNKEIYAWTVDKTVNMNKLLKLNVDGIITDKPQLLLNIKKKTDINKL